MRRTSTHPHRDILDTLHALGNFRELLRLIAAAGFVEDLGRQGPPLTLFAPSDAAFARIEGSVPALLDPRRDEMLIDLLEYHLVRGRLELDARLALRGARTVHGAELHFRAESGAIWADAARVHGEAIACTNGVVYVVDDVLAPALSEGQAWIAARTIGAAEPSAWDARTRARGSFVALEDLFLRSPFEARAEADAPSEPTLRYPLAFAAQGARFARDLAPIPLLPA